MTNENEITENGLGITGPEIIEAEAGNTASPESADTTEPTEAAAPAEPAESAEMSEPRDDTDLTEIIGVQFRQNGKIYYFDPGEFTVADGEAVIVETVRGQEYGCCRSGNHKVKSTLVVPPLRSMIRKATEEDTERRRYNESREKDAFRVCNERIASHNLAMKLIDVEYTFDNSKMLFYFTADGRVDFRDLVKDLASVFRTRIEMRQVGIRDEAKQLGGLGVCGRPFCCSTFLSDFGQVTIHMAKDQNLSLNSVKISGSCGRLMCCLRFEYETYADALKKLPPVESFVITPDGKGVVIELSALAGLVKVRLDPQEENTVKVYKSEDVKADPDRVFVAREEPEDIPAADRPSYKSFTDDRSVLPERGRQEKKPVRQTFLPSDAGAGRQRQSAARPAEETLDGIDFSNYDDSINDAPLPEMPDYFHDRTRFSPSGAGEGPESETAGENPAAGNDSASADQNGGRKAWQNRPYSPYRRRRYNRGEN